MIIRKLILIFLALLFCTASSAQALRFETSSVAIGPIDDWSQDVAYFIFTNTSEKKLAILRAETPADVKVKFPRKFIYPGETDTLIAWYLAVEPGPFSTSFNILTSASDREVKLRFSGDVLSLDACPNPTLAPGNGGPKREIVLLDSLTGLPVSGAEIRLLHNDRKEIKGRSNRKGRFQQELKPGLYEVTVLADSYHPFVTGFYLNISQRTISFLLSPMEKSLLPVSVETSQLDTLFEIPLSERTIQVDTVDDFVIALVEGVGVGVGEEGEEEGEEEELDAKGELSREVFAENNIVFLIDVSSSMRTRSKMERLIAALDELIKHLRDIDRISVITYSSHSNILLRGLRGDQKDSLMNVMHQLEWRGSTYGILGLTDAYALAQDHFIPWGNNQLILATDGEFNSPGFSDRKLENMMKDYRDSGIILSVIGFGQNDVAVKRMAMLAGSGGGAYLDFRPGVRVVEMLLSEIKMNSRKN